MLQFERAKPADAKTLALVSEQAFDADVQYGAPGPGGPPGYNSDRWQSKMMRMGLYYKIVSDGQIIGGMIVFPQRSGHYELGRMFLSPECQNQGIGAQAFAFLWLEFPLAQCWTLGTPVWNVRNRHFYKKIGFVEVGVHGDEVRFEKRV